MTNASDATLLQTHRLRDDGALFSMELNRQELSSDDFSTAVRDVTHLIQAGSACYTGEARFRKVFEKAILGIAIANTSGILLEVNESMAQLLGYTRQELIGMNIGMFTHPDDLVVENVYLKEIQIGERDDYRMNKRYMTKCDSLIWVDLLVTAIPDSKGNGIEVIGLAVDITERLRVDAELRGDSYCCYRL